MINTAIAAAREAGNFLTAGIGKVRSVETKKGEVRNLVSEMDRGAEAIIIRTLRAAFPTHQFLAEESGGPETAGDYTWVIDPLDGTTNYLHGVPIFCVSIGLHYRGETVAGVVYDPNTDDLFTAEKGGGAFLNGERLRVSAIPRLIDSLLVTGFPYNISENPDNAVEHFMHFLAEAQGIRRLGSAALDLCYTAAGRFDGFWEVNLNPWDIAAGALCVVEAGGRWSDFRGARSTIFRRQVVASNSRIHEDMIRVLARGNSGLPHPTSR